MRNQHQNRTVLGAGITLILVALLSIWRTPTNEAPSDVSGVKAISSQPDQVPAPAPTKIVHPIKAANEKPVIVQTPSSHPEFRSLLDKSYMQLVLSKDLSRVGARANHDTPIETYSDSENFGRIMDEVKANPALATEAMDFYERCALNSEVIAPTRAVCLSHLIYWSGKKSMPFNRDRFPAELIATAERLPVLWEIPTR